MDNMLPFDYFTVDCQDQRNYLDLINLTFGYSFNNEDFEVVTENIDRSSFLFYSSCKQVGFTCISSEAAFAADLFSIDLDGNADGLFESRNIEKNRIFIFKNHSKASFKFNCKRNIRAVIFKAKNEASLSTEKFSLEELSKFIDHNHLNEDSLKIYSNEFYEKSIIRLDNFLINPLETFKNINLWKRSGPADYRSFKYCTESGHLIHDLMKNKEFIAWLGSITGLPLLYPLLPIYTRCIQASGDYQILHGNYSEPLGLDLIYSFSTSETEKEWNEDSCGLIHYLNDSGDEIFQVNPVRNSLTIVYRNEGCSRFTENVKGYPELNLLQTIAIYSVAAED